MELRKTYQQTDIGVLPHDWEITTLGSLTTLLTNGFVGKAKDFYVNTEDGVLYVQGFNVQENGFNLHGIRRVSKEFQEAHQKSCLRAGDLLTIQTGDIGVTAVVPASLAGANCHALVISRLKRRLAEPGYYCHYFNSGKARTAFKAIETGSTMKHLNVGDMADLLLPRPHVSEQLAIAAALSEGDALLSALEHLIAKKRALRQAGMQHLLTGVTRLPGFNCDWREMTIADIAFPTSEKNTAGNDLPVLTCSKHRGFVDSLSYFRNQVFSTDTSTYKVIRRGQLGFPANHIEEGSIGFQDLYDVALVSPIYVVFSVNESADGSFLHRLLKLDSFRQEFKSATTSSVDRRGSLRWPVFSQITVRIPPTLDEQRAIVAVLSDMDADLAALEETQRKVRYVKQGMMQELLTGRIRLV